MLDTPTLHHFHIQTLKRNKFSNINMLFIFNSNEIFYQREINCLTCYLYFTILHMTIKHNVYNSNNRNLYQFNTISKCSHKGYHIIFWCIRMNSSGYLPGFTVLYYNQINNLIRCNLVNERSNFNYYNHFNYQDLILLLYKNADIQYDDI